MPVFVPIPHCFDYCSFAVLSEVSESYASCFGFFPQDCSSNSVSFMVPYKFLDYLFQFCEKCHRHFDREHIKSVDCFG